MNGIVQIFCHTSGQILHLILQTWFFANAKTNEIKSLAPVFDNNQALIALELGNEKTFDELIYDPVGKTML